MKKKKEEDEGNLSPNQKLWKRAVKKCLLQLRRNAAVRNLEGKPFAAISEVDGEKVSTPSTYSIVIEAPGATQGSYLLHDFYVNYQELTEEQQAKMPYTTEKTAAA